MGVALGGCSVGKFDTLLAAKTSDDVTGAIAPPRAAPQSDKPSAADLAFARVAASDVLTKGTKDASQPWENPSTGARGSVTPLASAYSSDGRTCRDFLASYVNGTSESWLHGAACRAEGGRWEIRTLKPWKQS
jgi:surface antigen